MFHHIVLIRLNERTPEGQDALRNRLLSMKGKIEQLRSIEAGSDVMNTDRSYDVVLITKFESREAMQAYRVHPVHQEVLAYIKSVAAASVTVDYVD